ncbi:PgaA family protein [Spirosoma validum]|uniref:Tetratricopeptide repeat protein n=1 Tax=Spirosoma validum TaxID=2771355 RepID=A0A927B809_9BACT|nr:hypothetical protein [Spirosoma validum]MBD2756901.1 hypothetical protein [Spirosoma validum]
MKRPADKLDEQDWIERYLNDQMPADERTSVEAEMNADPDFREEVTSLKRTHEIMHEAFLQQRAIGRIKQLQHQAKYQTHRIRLVRRSMVSFATVCVLFIAYLSFTPVSFPDSENDFSVTRSLSDDSVVVAQKRIFEQFFEGQMHLVDGQYALAVKSFEQIVHVTDIRPYFREAVQWHLAVAYLKSGQPDKANRIYDQYAHCIDCEYRIGLVNRWKLWWQIKWAQWT